MLLFFIAQISSSLASNCKVKSSIIIEDSIDVVVCDHKLEEHVKYGIEYWNKKGYAINLVKSRKEDCNSLNQNNTIYVQINNKKASQKDTSNYTYQAVTETTRGTISNKFYYSVVSLKETYLEEKPSNLIAHEIGHSLGFGHVNDECTGYLMNKDMSKMGLNF